MAKALTTEEFIKKAEKVHGDKYCYSQTIYIKTCEKVKIYCKKCKKYFMQTPNSHLSGCGCPSCGSKIISNKLALTTHQFIEKAIKIHGKDKYNYEEVNYIHSHKKIKIYCNTCNKFFYQIPTNHLTHGCYKCSVKNRTSQLLSTAEEFISKAKMIHGDKYNYNSVEYLNARTKVKIYCNTCEQYFWQLPVNHLSGRGHKKCCSDCFSPIKYGKAHNISTLYVIHMFNENENFYKIGISKNGVEKRFKYLKDYNYEIYYERQFSGFDARTLEIILHRKYKRHKVEPLIKFEGYTECFKTIDIKVVEKMITNYMDKG